MGPFVFDVLARYLLNKDRICNETLGLCANPHIKEISVEDVVNRILSTKPAKLADDDFINRLYAEIAADPTEREVIRAVHISDAHIDPLYAVGSIVNCGETICCRASSGAPGPDDDVAGEWGATKGPCDLPVKTFASMMEFVVADQKPDLIFWTGDNSPHTIWDNTVEEVTADTTLVTNIIKDAIEGTEISVFPIHGNHDTWPCDIEDFATANGSEPINSAKEDWADWLGPTVKDKYGEFGYYSMDIELRNGKVLPPNSKIIALNTNVCDNNNFY